MVLVRRMQVATRILYRNYPKIFASNQSNPRAISYFHIRYLTIKLSPSHPLPSIPNTPGLPSSTTTMALQIHHVCRPIPLPPSFSIGSLSSWSTKQSTFGGDIHRWRSFSLMKMIDSKTRKNKGLRSSVRVRSSLETSGPSVVVGQVTDVDKDTFWPIVNAAGDKTVVLDMYTQWCGPCKVIAPKFQEMAEEYLDVVFLKLDCNQENKPLAKELGIKVVPTFKILKHGKIVKEVTGAKLENLVTAIKEVRSS